MRRHGIGMNDARVKSALREMGVTDEKLAAVRAAKSEAACETLFDELKAICKKGYRAIAIKLHPDKNEGDPKQAEKTEQFKWFNSVYEGFMKAKVQYVPKVQSAPFRVFTYAPTYAATSSTSTTTAGFTGGAWRDFTNSVNQREQFIRDTERWEAQRAARARDQREIAEALRRAKEREKAARYEDLRYATEVEEIMRKAGKQGAKAARKRQEAKAAGAERKHKVQEAQERRQRRAQKRVEQKKAENAQTRTVRFRGRDYEVGIDPGVEEVFQQDGHTLAPDDWPRPEDFSATVAAYAPKVAKDAYDNFKRRYGG